MYLAAGLLSVILLTLLYLVIRKNKQNSRFYELLNKFDSLPSYPVIGNVHLLFKGKRKNTNLVERFYELCEGEKGPFTFYTGKLTVVVLKNLEDIQGVLGKLSHRESLGFVEDTFLNGIIAQNYGQWRKTRRIMNPAFGPAMLAHYLTVFNQQARVLCDILGKRADTGETTDLWPYLVNAAIDMATENLTGVRMNVQLGNANDFSVAVIDIMELTTKRIFNFLLHPKIFFNLYVTLTGKRKTIDIFRRYTRQATIEAKQRYQQQQMQRQNVKAEDVDEFAAHKEPKTTLDLLLAIHGSDPDMSEKQMQAELIHILTAGSESSAIILGFALMMLAIYPDAQERAYQEITDIMGEREIATLDDVNQLSFLDQCLKETIRIYTVLPATPRCTLEEMEISGGKVIPANCIVLCVLEAIHKNPQYYPNPDQWNPENFSPEAVEGRPKNTFVGFSLGPRACLGNKYAMISMKTQIIYLLRRFHIRTNYKYEDVETRVDVFKRSKNGYPLILDSRK